MIIAVTTKAIFDPIKESEAVARFRNDPNWNEVATTTSSVVFENKNCMGWTTYQKEKQNDK